MKIGYERDYICCNGIITSQSVLPIFTLLKTQIGLHDSNLKINISNCEINYSCSAQLTRLFY